MPWSGIAQKAYKEPVTQQYLNQIRDDIAAVGPHGIWAWVNFDSSNTAAILGSYNITSIVKDAAGKHTITFTTGFQNNSYCVGSMGSENVGMRLPVLASANALTARAMSIWTVDFSNGVGESQQVCVFAIGTGTGV